MTNRIWICLLLLFPLTLFGQDQAIPFGAGPNGLIRCYTTENMAEIRANDPNTQTREEFMQWITDKQAEEARNGYPNSRMVLTVPVVVHIIHNGESVGSGANISQAQVASQIDVLNEDFRRMMGTPGFNTDPVGADVEIEFCLAYLDDNMNPMPEPGINRIDRTTRGWTAGPHRSNYVNSTIKPATQWDINKYFNIWVTGLSGGILGYAQFPNSGSANTDGVVISTQYFGRVGNVTAPYNRGRTLTHEAGHWLGLFHIWGDGPCSRDDGCSDTPPSDDGNYGCPTNHVSCGNTDMVQNYMDYTDDVCMNIFTECQKGIMRTALMNSSRRAPLLNSLVCARATAAPTANFGFASIDSCTATVTFADSSLEFPTSWFWTFGDGNSSTNPNPVHTYASSGTYNVTLIVNNSFGTNNIRKQITVTVSAAASVNAGPDLTACAGETVTLNVNVSDPTATVRWSPNQGLLNPTSRNPLFQAIVGNTYFVTATDSTGCRATDTLRIDVVPKPLLNAGNDDLILPGDSTTLNPTSSKPIQSWQWSPLYGFRNPGDDTLQNPIVKPAQSVIYKLEVIDQDGCLAEDDMIVIVEGTPFVSIDEAFLKEFGSVHLPYPNPASSQVVFSASFRQTADLQLELYDLSGRRITTIFQDRVSQGEFSMKWQREAHIGSGLYFAVWRMGEKHIVQKIQLK